MADSKAVISTTTQAVVAMAAFVITGFVGLLAIRWFLAMIEAGVLAILVTCVIPGLIYVPVRIALGASPLPTTTRWTSVSFDSPGRDTSFGNKKVDAVFSALLIAYFYGYMAALIGALIGGVILLVVEFAGHLISINLLPAQTQTYLWVFLVACFSVGVTVAAVGDVNHDRANQGEGHDY